MKNSAPFWSWNGKLNAAELKRQMRFFKKMGFGGVFMHSRTGLATEYLSKRWFDMIKACIREGKKLGLKTWIYDEDRWPSGYAGGLVTRHKKFRMQWIYFDENLPGVPPAPGRTVGKFNINGKPVRFTVDCATSSNWYNGFCYANVMDRKATEYFLETTHERYTGECGKGDFPGVFTDEPQYGFFATKAEWSNSHWFTVPYDPKVRTLIKKRYHYDIFERLPELFCKDTGGEFNSVRYHYIKTVTELFRKNNVALIGKWHRKNGLIYTGHMMGEDSLITQTWNCGDVMSFYPCFGMPGIDQLGGHTFNHLPPRQLGSVARQYGQPERLAEIYGGTGWDYPPEGHQLIGDLLLEHGINFRCPHLSDYTISGEAKRDYPASISFQMPWCSDYNLVEERFNRLAGQIARSDRYAEILVISPVESVWGMAFSNFTQDAGVKAFDLRYSLLIKKLQKESIAFDLGSEILLAERGRVSGNKLQLGKIAYQAVILPEMKTIRSTTLELLQKFQAAGGTVVFASAPPERIDGETCPGKFPLVSENWSALARLSRWEISGDGGMLQSALFCQKRCERLLLTNTAATGRDAAAPWSLPLLHERQAALKNITVRWKSTITVPPCEYDPEKDRFLPVNAVRDGDHWVIKCDFDRLQTRMLVLDPDAEPVMEDPGKQAPQYITLPENFDYTLNGKNVLLLDHFFCDALDEQKYYILEIDDLLRRKLEIPVRCGDMVQPWAAPPPPEVEPLPVILRTEFESDITTLPLEVAMENPEVNTAILNGIAGEVIPGKWFIDPAFKIVRFPENALKHGRNTLEIRTAYDGSHPGLEAVYLLGDFAVDRRGDRIYELPERLSRGDMTDQGLPFFCGGVVCRFEYTGGTGAVSLRLPQFYGALARVRISGKAAGVIWHPPYELDITEFIPRGKSCTIEVELVNSPRNMLGPFYCKRKYICSAPLYFTRKEQEERTLVPLGFEKQLPDIL